MPDSVCMHVLSFKDVSQQTTVNHIVFQGTGNFTAFFVVSFDQCLSLSLAALLPTGGDSETSSLLLGERDEETSGVNTHTPY